MTYLTYPRSMRSLSLSLIIGIVLSGCLSIGSRQLKAPTSAKPKNEDSRVLLVVVDGLNHDVLQTYLRTLVDADHEPSWQSGLSLLAREQFRLANAQYPMSSIPAFTTTAEATLATGQPPIEHGLIGTRLSRLPSTAPQQDISVYDPAFQRAFLALVPNKGDATATSTKSGRLLNRPSWVNSLHPKRETVSVFMPYGQGGHWFVPVVTAPLVKAFVDTTVSKQTTLMLDQKVEELADDAIANRPHLVVMRFAGIRGQSCAPTSPGCKDASKSIAKRQEEALIELDQRLWRLFRNYQMRHPAEFDRTTFIITGTTGTHLRSKEVQNDDQYIVDTSAIESELQTSGDSTCSEMSTASPPKRWSYTFRSDSGFSILTMPHLVQGQRGIAKQHISCVLKRFNAVAQTLLTENKLDAVIINDPSSTQPSLVFSEDFKAHSGSLERRRLQNKLTSLVQPTVNGRIIGALFLKPPYIFSNSGQERVHLGNLRRHTIRFPLLIADKRLTQSARRQIEGASIDHIDIGPTIFGLLNPDSLKTSGLPRRPLLKVDSDQISKTQVIAYTHAQRGGYPTPKIQDSLSITEAADSITASYREDRTIWPPDHLSFSFDGLETKWSNETQTFNNENCIYTHVESGRTWSCTLPYPPKKSNPLLELTRTPAVNGVGTSQRQVPLFNKPSPVSISLAQSACIAGEQRVNLGIDAADGLASLTFQLSKTSADSGETDEIRLNPLNAVVLNDKQVYERLCSAKKLDDQRCRLNQAQKIVRLRSSVSLDINPTAEIPIKVFACSFGGQCSTREILNSSRECEAVE